MPATEPAKSSWVAELLGLYELEVDKWLVQKECRKQVRLEDLKAARG